MKEERAKLMHNSIESCSLPAAFSGQGWWRCFFDLLVVKIKNFLWYQVSTCRLFLISCPAAPQKWRELSSKNSCSNATSLICCSVKHGYAASLWALHTMYWASGRASVRSEDISLPSQTWFMILGNLLIGGIIQNHKLWKRCLCWTYVSHQDGQHWGRIEACCLRHLLLSKPRCGTEKALISLFSPFFLLEQKFNIIFLLFSHLFTCPEVEMAISCWLSKRHWMR